MTKQEQADKIIFNIEHTSAMLYSDFCNEVYNGLRLAGIGYDKVYMGGGVGRWAPPCVVIYQNENDRAAGNAIIEDATKNYKRKYEENEKQRKLEFSQEIMQEKQDRPIKVIISLIFLILLAMIIKECIK
jgi:hypothetical protein